MTVWSKNPTRKGLYIRLAALLLAACAREVPLPADLEPIPHPRLDAIEEIARDQLEEQRSELESRLAKGADRRELADAFGGMGELYHAYELLPAAAACYHNADSLDPGSFLWPYYLGALHQTAGDLGAAAESLERALTRKGDDLPTHRRLGEARLALGDAATARRHFEFLLEDNRFAAAAHFGLGRAAAAEGDFDEAVKHFEMTLELQPLAGGVHHPLGLALRRLDRPEEAKRHLEEKGVGEIHAPDRLMERLESLAVSSGAYLRRGNRALMSGRLEVAEEELRRAVAANPRATEARRNLALVLARRGNTAGAREELEEAARTDSENVWVQVDLGNAYMRLGLAEKAVAALQRAAELDPALVVARFKLANALAGLERWAEAVPHLQTVLELEPGQRQARYLAAMARHHGGETAGAVRELRTLLEDEPNDLEILEALAQLEWHRGRRQEALSAWRQATEVDPSSSRAFTNLANGLQLTGEREEARGLFAQAVELDPANATARLSEASLWILAGEFETARGRLEEAVAAAPDDPGILHTLARLLATCSLDSVRDGRRSLALARTAYGLENRLDHAETIGMALAELGQFEEAIRWQRGLVNQAAAGGDRDVLRRLMANLQLYEDRRPVRLVG